MSLLPVITEPVSSPSFKGVVIDEDVLYALRKRNAERAKAQIEALGDHWCCSQAKKTLPEWRRSVLQRTF